MASYGGGAKCAACAKSVYAADPKVTADGKVWHATCFNCEECKSHITLAKWAQLEGKNFCKPCFKKVFMLRGKYSDVGGDAPKAGGGGEGAAAAKGPPSKPPGLPWTPPSPPPADGLPPAKPAAASVVVPRLPVSPPEPAPAQKAAPAAGGGGPSYGGGSKCTACGKSVYAADPKVTADGKVWHATCFNCEECKSHITLAKWAQLEGKNFCKPCFNKVFSARGKYDDVASGKFKGGAGGDAPAAPAPAAAPAAPAPEPAKVPTVPAPPAEAPAPAELAAPAEAPAPSGAADPTA